MNHNRDTDSGEAPDAIDRLLERSKRVRSLPGPGPEFSLPALGPPSPTVKPPEERVPAAEVSLSPKHVYVTVDLPGAAKDAMEIEATERRLTLRAPRLRREIYRLEIQLPAAVDPESAKATYRNGVLDVTLARRRRERGGPHDE